MVSPTAVAWISCHLWVHRRRFAQWFFPWGQCYLRNQNNHMAAPVKVARQQTTPELSGTFQTLPPEPTLSGTLRNLPRPSGTNLSEPSGTYLQNLRIHRSPPKSSGTCLRNPSGTCLRNLHQHTPEPSGTFWNLPPEPTPAHAGTLRNLPEPSSGTCSCDPHRHTPELIWAEDPISLRCWGIKSKITSMLRTRYKTKSRTKY